MASCASKIVVFDLDETMGYFVELGMLWDALLAYADAYSIPCVFDQPFFNELLDLYPELLRPSILEVLMYLKEKKETNHCHKLMIYTNNQGPIEWAQKITGYFDAKLNCKLIDQIIAAFKIKGKKVELCRTTHVKTHADLIKCTQLPEDTQICFLDDMYYPEMSNSQIYYINVKPYIYDLEFDDMIHRFLSNENLQKKMGLTDVKTTENFSKFVLKYMQSYNYIYVAKDSKAHNIDKIITKKIIQHLIAFFALHQKRKTRKRQMKKKPAKSISLKCVSKGD